ncbi:Zinc finger protein [Musa troglodytarum]|uniref:Zinc finger protein n=1 Tax=Musa troglodytarum TaxID=320322 RepID=A0A9E7K0V4_9LILI|nr:Zinc finger protein [Musa troglodytarum]
MATGWVKSLHCKSNAVEDVVYYPTPSSSSSSSVSCGTARHTVKDVILLAPNYSSSSSSSSSSIPKKPRHKTRPKSKHKPRTSRPCASPPPVSASELVGPARAEPIPTLTELPAGHSSRRVVEIIFSSSWCSSGAGAFPSEIEMLFRVHNPARTVARFEEHRASVRARADDARCAADGNEMMRFHSGRAGGVVYDAGVARSAAWSAGRKVEGVRTFAGSGGAHASGGGGAGRRGMLVCRVIAGRVRRESDPEREAESVSLGNGELLVFDPTAVLPCFLIIYKL